MNEHEYNEQDRTDTGGNPMAVVGFVLSFCTGPIGLIVCLVALRKAPRGFAIAGIIVSLLSTLALAVAGFFITIGLTMGLKAAEVTEDFDVVKRQVADYRAANADTLPASLDDLTLSAEERTDPWGTAYRIEANPDGTDFVFVCAGMDGQFETGDDMRFTPDMNDEAIAQMIGEAMESHFKEKYGG